MRKNFAARAIAFLLAVALGGCDALGIDDDDRERDRLARNVRLWSENQPANYRYEYERLCFCPIEIASAVEISVENGTVAGRRYVASGQPVPAQFTSLFPPMEGVFEVIEDALDRKAEQLQVSYDNQYGFPVNASIDFILNAIDDELVVRVRNFTPY